MIPANELRIGNIVIAPFDDDKDIIIKIQAVNGDSEKIRPFPLYENAVLKCGFVKTNYTATDDGYDHRELNFYLHPLGDGYELRTPGKELEIDLSISPTESMIPIKPQ